jgi:hypothetical protein
MFGPLHYLFHFQRGFFSATVKEMFRLKIFMTNTIEHFIFSF